MMAYLFYRSYGVPLKCALQRNDILLIQMVHSQLGGKPKVELEVIDYSLMVQ